MENAFRQNRLWRGATTSLAFWGACLPFFALQSAPSQPADIRRDSVVQAVERVMPSVVNIATRTRGQRRTYMVHDWWRDNWGPFMQEAPPQFSAGSGFIIDEEGYVLTNVHVVEQADEVWVKLSNSDRIIQAQPIVGLRSRDLAILKLMGKPGEKFQAVKLGAADDLLLGETVVALGNPFGLGGSVSRGILSAKNRRSSNGAAQMEVADWLQTDAAINPGNSGGPLINLKGEVIGVNVAVYKQGQGIGFAIPVKQVSETLHELFTPEIINKLWIGARVRGNPLQVTSVQSGSPAELAGLRTGDQIVSINGKAPKSFIEFSQLFSGSDGKEVTLVARTREERRTLLLRPLPLASLVRQKLGLEVQELTPNLAGGLGFSQGSGLLIAGVDKNSPAQTAGLAAGQVLAVLDGQRTTDILTAAHLLSEKKKGDSVEVGVLILRQTGRFREIVEGEATFVVR